MKSLKRYTVTVKENGDSFTSLNEKDCKRWAGLYADHVANQDNPWEPHFEMATETLNY